MVEKTNKFKKNALRKKPEEAKTPPKMKSSSKVGFNDLQKQPKKVKPKSDGSALKSIVAFIKDEKFHKVIGLFLTLFSIFLFVSFTSYLFTWKADDHIFSSSSILFDSALKVDNVMGKLGAIFAHLFIKNWFGISSYLIVIVIFVIGLKIFLNVVILPLINTLKYSLIGLIWFSVALAFLFRSGNSQILGGVFGFQSVKWLESAIGGIGAGILIFFTLVSIIIFVYNTSLKNIAEKIKRTPAVEKEIAENEIEVVDTHENKTNRVISDFEEAKVEEEELNEDEKIEANIFTFDVKEKEVIIEEEKESKINEVIFTEDTTPIEIEKNKTEKSKNTEVEFTVENQNDEENNSNIELSEVMISMDDHDTLNQIPVAMEDYDPTLELSNYKFPTLDLLNDYTGGTTGVQKEELEANKNRIVETLNNYAIQIDKIKATIGPTVTLYEIIPAPGVRISRIKNLEDDIALSLSALGIRIIAPIPGKGTIGIEVPNQNPEMVPMKSILSSEKFINGNFDLPIGLGKTISNESFVADLTKMPHLLMAGATGQGKSVGLNAILASLLYKKHPSQVKFVLVDPKKVELSLFSKIERHFLAKLPDSEEAIITDTKKVVRTLNSLCIEMDQRYDLLKDAQVRNIKEYNAKFISRRLNPNNGHHFLPYIVLVVDEFADLIMTAGKEVEAPITRLAQLARAIGIHLIIATQRPSVNIITGTIKANFPARIAFKVSSKIDSRTILDTGGADQLIGKGDMLLSNGNELIRIQCAFIDTPEVEAVTDFIGNQRAYPEAHMLPEVADETTGDSGKSVYDPTDRDDLFEEAARIIVEHQHGSTSLIQRKLKLGYNRAGRIVDQLEAAGIIGQFEGSKARDVKIKDLYSLEQFLKGNNNNI
ncbi:MAG: DNA translocase FtsK 4TM domain-containing protein [Bacteroidetes bacterium]|nr:DNA translocase FtsK 4TM domain-containing protein [Bacteroidota bacterium]